MAFSINSFETKQFAPASVCRQHLENGNEAEYNACVERMNETAREHNERTEPLRRGAEALSNGASRVGEFLNNNIWCPMLDHQNSACPNYQPPPEQQQRR